MSELVKDVAKELDRRRFRRRIIALAIWIVAIVLAVLYLRCGTGTGSGGQGGSTSGKAPARRCQLRIDSKGISVDGHETNRDTAVEICKKASGAEVTVIGDARHGDVLALQAALVAAHIDVLTHDPSHH
jgi:hypothetical protein